MTLSITPLVTNLIQKAILARKDWIYMMLENQEQVQQKAEEILIKAIEVIDKRTKKYTERGNRARVNYEYYNWFSFSFLPKLYWGFERALTSTNPVFNPDQYVWILDHRDTGGDQRMDGIGLVYQDAEYQDAFNLLIEAGLVKDYYSQHYCKFYIPPEKFQFARELRDAMEQPNCFVGKERSVDKELADKVTVKRSHFEL